MPSAAKSGLEARVRISTDAGSNWSTWSEPRASTLNIDGVEANVTNRGTSVDGSGVAWMENQMIMRNWSGSVDANLVDDAFNDTLNTYAMGLTPLYFEFAADVGSGIPRFRGYGNIRIADSSPNNDVTVRNITISAAGPLTVADQ